MACWQVQTVSFREGNIFPNGLKVETTHFSSLSFCMNFHSPTQSTDVNGVGRWETQVKTVWGHATKHPKVTNFQCLLVCFPPISEFTSFAPESLGFFRKSLFDTARPSFQWNWKLFYHDDFQDFGISCSRCWFSKFRVGFRGASHFFEAIILSEGVAKSLEKQRVGWLWNGAGPKSSLSAFV